MEESSGMEALLPGEAGDDGPVPLLFTMITAQLDQTTEVKLAVSRNSSVRDCVNKVCERIPALRGNLNRVALLCHGHILSMKQTIGDALVECDVEEWSAFHEILITPVPQPYYPWLSFITPCLPCFPPLSLSDAHLHWMAQRRRKVSSVTGWFVFFICALLLTLRVDEIIPGHWDWTLFVSIAGAVIVVWWIWNIHMSWNGPPTFFPVKWGNALHIPFFFFIIVFVLRFADVIEWTYLQVFIAFDVALILSYARLLRWIRGLEGAGARYIVVAIPLTLLGFIPALVIAFLVPSYLDGSITSDAAWVTAIVLTSLFGALILAVTLALPWMWNWTSFWIRIVGLFATACLLWGEVLMLYRRKGLHPTHAQPLEYYSVILAPIFALMLLGGITSSMGMEMKDLAERLFSEWMFACG